MDNKVKISIVKLVELEDKILDIYRNIIKKEIYNENIEYEIEKIKELKKQEIFLNELSYEQLKQILNYIEKSEGLYCLLIQRISNLLNITIDKLYLKERLEEDDEDIDDEYIEFKTKENTVIEYLERDLILLRIKKLTDRINNCNIKDIRNRLINYKYLHLYSNILVEEETLNTKFNINNLHLLNILATQLSELPEEEIEDIYRETSEYEIGVGSVQNIININNIVLSEGINKENSKFIETEIIINTSFLEAEMEIFSINKESIIEYLENKLTENNSFIIDSLNKNINDISNKKTSYLTLIRKK